MIIRPARPEDVPTLDRVIAASARQLSAGYYDAAQTEAAIAHVFGIDSELIADGTYLLVDIDGQIAGCGGWSRRATLFGSDRFSGRQSGYVDPATAPAKIRAFFIAPEFARRGIGTALLTACEEAARAAGFSQAELMATLPGVPFYATHGYLPGSPITQVYDGVEVRFVPMHRSLRALGEQEAGTNSIFQA
ncbi:GNAT family N-acetyltransferase [Blastomonas sp. AAP53]|uniref:GNAT family N-acetyltransferase n=1 Tax=Blastomonas sp. AAP53 TaxID=1248760 RepID=UPI000318130E|nr:GNAT family N-acetyltransferase [Blastomonas sp. AAP53]